MFAHALDTYAELRLLEDRFSSDLFALIDKERASLRKWLPWVDATRRVDDTREFSKLSRERFAQGTSIEAGIWLGGKIAGVIGLTMANGGPTARLGYWIGADYQGKGLVTRASRSVIQHAFFGLGIDRVEIRSAVDNVRGQQVPQRLGFVNEGVARHAVWVNGVPQDITMFSMLAKDWRG
jgi:ribosomal-protein-serine acetyltransferase